MLHIKVVGVNDSKSRQLKENVERAVAICSAGVELYDVEDVNEIISLGIKTIPALIVEDNVISEGVVLTTEEVAEIIMMRVLYNYKLSNIQKILAPIDYSHNADGAFRYAYRLAAYLHAGIVAMHVCDPLAELGRRPSVNTKLSIEEVALADLNKYLKEILANPEALGHDANPQLTTMAMKGNAEMAIIEASHDFDLIVMGTKGLGGPIDRLFGTISTHIARKAYSPVLFVPPGVYFDGFSDILYAADFETTDSLSIQQFLEFAQCLGSQVHFVHVNTSKDDGRFIADTIQRNLKVKYTQFYKNKPFVYESIEDTHFINAINRYAANYGIKLIVFATPHRKGWDILLHQSHTNQMLFDTNIPLLVLHLNEDMRTI